MVGRRTNILFLFCLILFLVHQVLQKMMGIRVELLDSYLDPLLAMPVILHLVTYERRLLLKNRNYTIPALHIWGYFVLISVFGEIIFPLFSDQLVADVWDILFYGVGALCYAVAQFYRFRM